MLRNTTPKLDVLVNVNRMQELIRLIESSKAALKMLIERERIDSQALEVALDTLTDAVENFEQRKYRDFLTDKTDRADAVLTQFDLYAALHDELGLGYYKPGAELLNALDEYSDAVEQFYYAIKPELENSTSFDTSYDADTEADFESDSSTEIVSDFEPDYSGWRQWGSADLNLLNLEFMAAWLAAEQLNFDAESSEGVEFQSPVIAYHLLPEDLFQSADDSLVSEQGINSADFEAWIQELDSSQRQSSTEALSLDSEGRIMNNVISEDSDAPLTNYIDDDSDAEEVLDTKMRVSQTGMFSRTTTPASPANSEQDYSPALPRAGVN